MYTIFLAPWVGCSVIPRSRPIHVQCDSIDFEKGIFYIKGKVRQGKIK